MTEHLLVTTDWLAAHLDDPTVRIVDIRGHAVPATEPPPHYFNHRDSYLQEHIPGAVFIDWVREITDPESYMHALIAGPERFAELMGRMGIGADTFVVAYDDANSMFAARVWWSLNYYGHDKVAVLDGGWDKWVAEGLPTEGAMPEYPPAEFVARPNPAWIRTGDYVMNTLNDPNTKLVDVRTQLEYSGEVSRGRRSGHIPGALNQPRRTLISPDGTMLAQEELRKVFAALGIDAETPEVISYCNAGVSGSYGLLALRVAGIKNSALYDGSWKDWANDDTRPIE